MYVYRRYSVRVLTRLRTVCANHANYQSLTRVSPAPPVTRSAIEVAHFRYSVSERRVGSLTHNRRDVNLDFEKTFL